MYFKLGKKNCNGYACEESTRPFINAFQYDKSVGIQK